MRVQCSHCDASVDRAGLDAFPHGFGFVCERCNQVTIVAEISHGGTPTPTDPKDTAPVAKATGSDIESKPGNECPKCRFQNPESANACHRCGLSFEYVASGRAAFALDPLHRHPAAERIREKWRHLAAHLDERESHLKFIELCREQSLLQFAGQCYRDLESERPGDPRVSEYRNRVIAASMVGMDFWKPTSSGAGSSRTKGLILLCIAALILLGFAVGFYLLSQQQISWQHNG